MRKLMLSLAVMAAMLPISGYSLGLGDLELKSALNQELDAEIKVLSATTDDAEQLIVRLASREAFSRAGLDRPFLLQQLKFKLIDKDGTPYVKVFTKGPVREPFLSFLVEIDWPQGHLLREYTLLLDPPVFNSKAAAASSSGASFNEPAESQAQTQSVSAQNQSAQPTAIRSQGASDSTQQENRQRQTQNQTQSQSNAEGVTGKYRVQSNDTLYEIADKLRKDKTISVEQMMLALVRKNPNAFIRKNINGVKRGYILRMPNQEETTHFDREQAIAQAQEHTALWREYRQNRMMASDSPASSMAIDETQATTPEQSPEEDARLSIVSAGASDNGQAGSERKADAALENLKQDLAMAREQIETERLEKESLRDRLAELKDQVKRIIELKDGNLAELQQALQPSEQGADTIAEPMDSAKTPASEEQAMDGAADTPEGMPEDKTVNETETAAKSEDVFVDETVPDESLDDEPKNTMDVQDEVAKTPAFAQKKSKNVFEQLMDDPKLMGVIIGALAFIFILIALLLKRMRGNKVAENEWSAVGDDAPLDLADIEDAIKRDADDDITIKRDEVDMASTLESTSEMLLGSEDDEKTRLKIPEGEEAEGDTVLQVKVDDDEDRDDIIAEADVYLAYGIYQQAEELLHKAITENPERNDYRMKLLETHFASKDADKFEQLAKDLQPQKEDEKIDWNRVVAMGMDLCPNNDLFTSDDDTVIADFSSEELLSDDLDNADLELEAPSDETPDFDLGLDDLGLDDLDETSDNIQVTDEEAFDEEELDLTDDLKALDDETLSEDETSSDLEADLGELDVMDEDDQESDDAIMDEDQSLDAIDDDFSLDFNASDLGLEESEESVDVLDEMGEIDLSEDLADEASDNIEEFDVGELDLDEAELDDAIEQDVAAETTENEIAEDELTDEDKTEKNEMMTEDLVEVDEIAQDASESDVSVTDDGSDFDISELSEEVDEVSTKLALAKAYIDMGDNDGARSILEEVKEEGSEEQQQKAEELLQQAS